MPDRKKILIIERDDFLREIIGNLLHKKGIYILNAFCVQDGIQVAHGQKIDTILLGTSCGDYHEGKTINYIKKNIPVNDFYIINDSDQDLNFVDKNMQMKISELSIQKIIDTLS